MIKHSTNHWTLENGDGALFFAQRLSELLFEYTLDTYKPSALNCTALCKEALQVIRDVGNDIIDAANIEHVLDELAWSIKNDPVAKKLLDADVAFYILRGDKISRETQALRLEVLLNTLNPQRYHFACESRLKESIRRDAKGDIEVAARNYVTNMLNFGVSKEFLYELTKSFFFDPASPIVDLAQIDEFFKALEPKYHSFDVYFKSNVSIHEVKDSNPAFSIRVLSELPEEVVGVIGGDSFKCSEGECYVVINSVRATDRISAYAKAEQRLDTVSDLLIFYTHKKTLHWSPSALIRQKCCADEVREVTRPMNAMAKGRNFRSDFAAARLNSLIQNISLSGGSFRKFNQVVDLHGMALASDVPSNQLLNLWIAIETIVPSSRGGKTTVQRITGAIMPFILEGYVRRLVVNLTKDLYRWNRRKSGEILNKAPAGGKLTAKVLQMLALEECDDLRAEFYSILQDFPLLRQRIRTMAEKLASPKSVIAMLEQHRQKVEWQMRRIYRTRNSVVHAGDEPEYTSVLIENCHDYLDIVLNSIIRLSCKEYSISSLEQAFEMGDIHYQKFCRKLKENESFSASHLGFIVGDI